MKLVKTVVCVALLVSFVLIGLSSTAAAQSVLTPDEEAGLLQMREEEKLARDVYIAMYATWGKRIFDNISESEQRHLDAVLILLGRYGLDDPASALEGAFNDDEIQALYSGLITIGEDSLPKALCAGVFIEDLDIKDLTELIATTKRPDIKRAYMNLLAGSYNHLDAFMENLDLLGAACEEYQEEFDAVVKSLK